MKKLTSASKIILFPSGQMTWSTWERTLSQVSSGVRRLACRRQQHQSHLCLFWSETPPWALVCLYEAAAYHVDLRVWVAHVAHNGAVLHPVQLVSGHHVLVPCKETTIKHLLPKTHWEVGKVLLCMSTVVSAVTSARDDDINLTDDLVQLDHSESIHAEANEEERRGWNIVWQNMDLAEMLSDPAIQPYLCVWTWDWELVPVPMSLTRPARRRSGRSLSRTRWLPELSELHNSLSPPAKTKAASPHNKIRRNEPKQFKQERRFFSPHHNRTQPPVCRRTWRLWFSSNYTFEERDRNILIRWKTSNSKSFWFEMLLW